jgi:anti-sigma regulatory factor (Ser/Thr protein kinase)
MQIIRGVISSMGLMAGFSEKEARMVTLAVDEACANIIRHTYKNAIDCPVHLLCELTEESLQFRLIDFGEPLDPRCIKHRDLNELRPGGLGTYFMKNILDGIEYKNRPGGGNEITMTKYLPGRQEETKPEKESGDLA